jgi:hypothetical protein
MNLMGGPRLASAAWRMIRRFIDPQAKLLWFWQAFLFWLKLGFISFGGPAGQISIMHQELVERRRWISERRFCTRSTTAWCCPARRRSNWPPTSAG